MLSTSVWNNKNNTLVSNETKKTNSTVSNGEFMEAVIDNAKNKSGEKKTNKYGNKFVKIPPKYVFGTVSQNEAKTVVGSKKVSSVSLSDVNSSISLETVTVTKVDQDDVVFYDEILPDPECSAPQCSAPQRSAPTNIGDDVEKTEPKAVKPKPDSKLESKMELVSELVEDNADFKHILEKGALIQKDGMRYSVIGHTHKRNRLHYQLRAVVKFNDKYYFVPKTYEDSVKWGDTINFLTTKKHKILTKKNSYDIEELEMKICKLQKQKIVFNF